MDASHAAEIAQEYVLSRSRTAANFDLRAGTWGAVNADLVYSTRIFSSRISRRQEEWFIQTAETAPWNVVPLGSKLIDADPEERGGLFDGGQRLWRHFADAAIPGVRTAKISKVLHAMRPTFFPVLDSRLIAKFRERATQASGGLRDVIANNLEYWVVIRDDIIRNEPFLNIVRAELRRVDQAKVREWAEFVSDVRLHDVLMWSSPSVWPAENPERPA